MAKNYIKGSGKEVVFNNGGRILNMYLLKEDLMKLDGDKNGYIRICAAERREEDDYGNTHSVYEDDFVPKKKEGNETKKAAPRAQAKEEEDNGDDELPF